MIGTLRQQTTYKLTKPFKSERIVVFWSGIVNNRQVTNQFNPERDGPGLT